MNYAHMSEKEYYDIVLKRLKEYMNKNGVKQLDLSRESNINQSTLSKILNGEIKLTLQHIFRICNVLQIDPEILLSFDQEIISDRFQKINSGVISKNYINDQIFIRNPLHLALKGYITEKPFFLYLFSTISSEHALLEGTIKFEDTEYHNYCKATMSISTGLVADGIQVVKDYCGELIVSLTMVACYCILINSDIGEICSLNFKHSFLFNQKLICRVATVISTSSGSNRLPIVQRALISKTELHVNDEQHPDYEFVRGQLRLNDSEIIIKNDRLKRIHGHYASDEQLKGFFKESFDNNNINVENLDDAGYSVFDENKIRAINIPLDIKARGISILRNGSISPKYNKISTKTEEFTFQYIHKK